MKYAFKYDGKAFILKADDGSTVRVGPRHEKYEYVQSVKAGRVIGISKAGRWTNAKDYYDIYEKVTFGKGKAQAPGASKATSAKQKRKTVTKAKTAPKAKQKRSASNSGTDRIQALEAKLAKYVAEIKELKTRLKKSEAKVGRLQDESEKAALREVKALMLASEMQAKATTPKPSKPRGKKRVIEAKAHVDINWWKEKDYYSDPGGKGSDDFYVRIKCVKKHDYTRLTKSMIKDAVTSALESTTYGTSEYLNGWKFEWSMLLRLNYGGYDSKRGVRVRVLSIEEQDHAIIG